MPKERGGGKADVMSVSKLTLTVVPEKVQWTVVGTYWMRSQSEWINSNEGASVSCFNRGTTAVP